MKVRHGFDCCHRLLHWSNATHCHLPPQSPHQNRDFASELRKYQPLPRKCTAVVDQNQSVSSKACSRIPSYKHVKPRIDTGLKRKPLGQLSSNRQFIFQANDSFLNIQELKSTILAKLEDGRSALKPQSLAFNNIQGVEQLEQVTILQPQGSQNKVQIIQDVPIQTNQAEQCPAQVQAALEQPAAAQPKEKRAPGPRLSIRVMRREFKEVFAERDLARIMEAVQSSGRFRALVEKQGYSRVQEFLEDHLKDLVN